MKALIINKSKSRVPRTFVDEWVKSVGRELKSKKNIRARIKKELTLVFLDKPKARQLNRQFRGKDYATDVLSFEPAGYESSCESMGELVLCPEVIKKQSVEHGLSFRLELGYMIIHGILHLMGYDHEKSDRAAAQMYRLQDSLFEKLRTD